MMLGFWFILVASIVVTWPSLFSGYRFKLEAEYLSFIFSKETFQTLARNYLFCVHQKVFRDFIYLILFSPGIYLFKFWLKRSKRVYFFIFLKWHKFFKLIETTSSFSKASILINKAHLVLMLSRGLHITCKTYYNLSIKTENYQSD